MKKENPGARKLSEIRETEGIVPFLMAISRGEASINEKVGSKPLVETYFRSVYRAGNPTAPLLLQMLQRFRCLVVLGASTRSIVRKYYQEMMERISGHLNMVTATLEYPELFEGRQVLLKGLLQRLEALEETIDESGLLEDTLEEDCARDKPQSIQPPTSSSQLDQEIYWADRLVFLLDILLWGHSTKMGILAESVRLRLLRKFRQRLTKTIEAITDSGLTVGMGGVPTPWEIQITQHQELSEAFYLTGTLERDLNLMIDLTKKIHERLERGESLEEGDEPFHLFGLNE